MQAFSLAYFIFVRTRGGYLIWLNICSTKFNEEMEGEAGRSWRTELWWTSRNEALKGFESKDLILSNVLQPSEGLFQLWMLRTAANMKDLCLESLEEEQTYVLFGKRKIQRAFLLDFTTFQPQNSICALACRVPRWLQFKTFTYSSPIV